MITGNNLICPACGQKREVGSEFVCGCQQSVVRKFQLYNHYGLRVYHDLTPEDVEAYCRAAKPRVLRDMTIAPMQAPGKTMLLTSWYEYRLWWSSIML